MWLHLCVLNRGGSFRMLQQPWQIWQNVKDNSEKKDKKRGVSYFYRTATTSYLCYVPVLEESEGAGRRRLTPAAKIVIYSKNGSGKLKV